MIKETTAVVFDTDEDDDEEDVQYEQIGKCPLCNIGLHPDILSSVIFNNHLYLTLACPSCENVFFIKYYNEKGVYHIENIMPKAFTSQSVSESIRKISPSFLEIFSQAEEAERQNLSEICGLGYRKAVEFLVKDYLCATNPENESAIKEQSLGTCIKEGIIDVRIKTLAQRATWIGNDATHYIKKHKNLDVQDMKRFIRAMEAFIDAEQAFHDALEIEPK